ncbi:MAG: endonuclease domain-containing protein [Bacteroidota bacterium]
MQSKPSPYILRLSREFRKKQTETESLLWSRLRSCQLGGLKFRRQHPIGRYIADFCCYEHRLVIEVDGGVHMKQDQRFYDKLRQEDIEAQGYRVVRVTTEEVKRDIAAVLRTIRLASLASPPRSPSPVGEGEGGEVECTP